MRVTLGILCMLCSLSIAAAKEVGSEYLILATSKTSTMEREMNEAASSGYVFSATMGGETAFGGNEALVAMVKTTSESRKRYKLLATSKTSTMQKEMNSAGEEGFRYCGQTVFQSTFGGQEVAVILELDMDQPARRYVYRLLSTSKTSTMQKELNQAGSNGFGLLGLTVGKTAFGGNELVSILSKASD